MEFENLIKISSMVNAIYCNIQGVSCEEVENDAVISEQIDKWENDLKSMDMLYD